MSIDAPHKHSHPPTLIDSGPAAVDEKLNASAPPSPASLARKRTPSPERATVKKGWRFWAIISSLMVATFISALDVTAAATALPSIANSLQATDYAFIGTSYSIASTAIIPWSGGLCNIFGRRPIMLAGLGAFLLGSILCGEAHNMDMMLAGRSFQGIGGGMILAGTEIIFSDLVPLSERGTYQGAFGAVWAAASAFGPLIGAGTAQTNWRWLFRLNYFAVIPIMAIVAAFVNLKTPPGTLLEKAKKMDWTGNACFIPSISLFIIGLSWGGNEYDWTDAHVLAPLIVGVIGLVLWCVIEYAWVEHPTVPFRAMANRTTWLGFGNAFLHGNTACALFYYLVVYFQSAKGSSPMRSAVQFFPVELTVTPASIVAGWTIARTGRYIPQNVIGWALITLGPGVLSICRTASGVNLWATLPIPYSIGIGMIYSGSTFPVLAPLPPSLAGQALAFQAFMRSFGNILGITIGSAVLANTLNTRLPASYLDTLPGGVAGAYAAIPNIGEVAQPLRDEVRYGWGEAIRVLWWVMVPVGFVGVVTCCFMKHISLQTETDDKWGIDHHQKDDDVEKAEAEPEHQDANTIAHEVGLAIKP